MKAFGLIFIFGLMVWSWTAFYSPNKGVTEQTMIDIQNSLQDQMLKVMEDSPLKLNNIVFKKFWTKQISKDQVQAQFVITFDEETQPEVSGTDTAPVDEEDITTTKVERSGNVILVKADESNEEQVWIIESIKIEGEVIEFQKGLKFTSKAEN